MKTRLNGLDEPRYWNHVASFGQAQLLSRPNGRFELRGGSASDRTEAKEWISLFHHEVVPRVVCAN